MSRDPYSRADDVIEMVNSQIDQLGAFASAGGSYAIAVAGVRVLGSIAVTLAMMLDHMNARDNAR